MAESPDSLRISATDAFLPRLPRHGHRAMGGGTGQAAPGSRVRGRCLAATRGPLKLRPPHPDRLLTAD